MPKFTSKDEEIEYWKNLSFKYQKRYVFNRLLRIAGYLFVFNLNQSSMFMDNEASMETCTVHTRLENCTGQWRGSLEILHLKKLLRVPFQLLLPLNGVLIVLGGTDCPCDKNVVTEMIMHTSCWVTASPHKSGLSFRIHCDLVC